jgi:hypothetical protein
MNLKIDAGAAVLSTIQYIISMKDSGSCILVSAYASTVYAVRRMKSKTKQILPTGIF